MNTWETDPVKGRSISSNYYFHVLMLPGVQMKATPKTFFIEISALLIAIVTLGVLVGVHLNTPLVSTMFFLEFISLVSAIVLSCLTNALTIVEGKFPLRILVHQTLVAWLVINGLLILSVNFRFG